jgi:hypothetical protein
MTEEKDRFEKSPKSDSTEPEEPIDISGLMNSDDEDDDDGIIELKDEVTPPSKSDDEIIAPKTEAQEAGEEDDDLIELTDHVSMEDDAAEGEIKLPKDEPVDFEIEDKETEEDLFTLTDDAMVETGDDEDLSLSEEEISLQDKEDEELFSLSDDMPFEAEDDDDDMSFEAEDDDGLLKPIDESGLDLEEEESPISLVGATDNDQRDDEIIEITEFDDQIPTEDQDKFDLADNDDQTDSDEEDFLELLDVEEESPEEDEDHIDFDAAEDEMDDAEIENFFSESFDEEKEEIEFDQKVEDEVAESLGMDLESDLEMTEDTTDEDIDFKFDTEVITDKKDELDTILFESTSAASVIGTDEETPEADEPPIEDVEETAEVADLGTISNQQIEDAIERLIQQNYSEKIEAIIVQVIEKAVSNEIEKLKDMLFKDITDNE